MKKFNSQRGHGTMLRNWRGKQLLRAILRFVFGGAGSTAAAGSPAAANGAETTADAQKRVVAAILDLRAVVKSGSAEQIAAAVDVFKAKATADDLEPRELADEVARAEPSAVETSELVGAFRLLICWPSRKRAQID